MKYCPIMAHAIANRHGGIDEAQKRSCICVGANCAWFVGGACAVALQATFQAAMMEQIAQGEANHEAD